jgi:hypothetical protein
MNVKFHIWRLVFLISLMCTNVFSICFSILLKFSSFRSSVLPTFVQPSSLLVFSSVYTFAFSRTFVQSSSLLVFFFMPFFPYSVHIVFLRPTSAFFLPYFNWFLGFLCSFEYSYIKNIYIISPL